MSTSAGLPDSVEKACATALVALLTFDLTLMILPPPLVLQRKRVRRRDVPGPDRARAWPRDAGFAREDSSAVFAVELAQIQAVHLNPVGFQHLFSQLQKSIGLGHFPGAGLVIARRT